jgi:hypothetical protein
MNFLIRNLQKRATTRRKVPRQRNAEAIDVSVARSPLLRSFPFWRLNLGPLKDVEIPAEKTSTNTPLHFSGEGDQSSYASNSGMYIYKYNPRN